MSYVIQSVAVMQDTLNTEVLFTLSDNSQQTLVVSHLQPADLPTVLQNIVDEETALNAVIAATANNISLAAVIDASIQAGTAVGS